MSACNSGHFSQLQLCQYNYTYCSDSGAFNNITFHCLCQSGYLVIGNISTQYFHSELCAPPTTTSSGMTPSDSEIKPLMIALFVITIGLGLVAIGAVALNVLLIL